MTVPGLPRTYSCELSRTGNHVEALSLRAIGALPRHVELLITSRLLTAKDPQQLRVRHRSIVPADAVVSLKETLDEFLRAGSDGTKQAAVED